MWFLNSALENELTGDSKLPLDGKVIVNEGFVYMKILIMIPAGEFSCDHQT